MIFWRKAAFSTGVEDASLGWKMGWSLRKVLMLKSMVWTRALARPTAGIGRTMPVAANQ
jgi:hypothetical protein